MKPARLVLVALVLFAVLLALAPSAEACIQVYPYSELCDGDVRGFLDGMLP